MMTVQLRGKQTGTEITKTTELAAHASLTTTAHGGVLPSTSFSGLAKITVSASAPGTPSAGDLWVDTT
jgi:hypothetical protein